MRLRFVDRLVSLTPRESVVVEKAVSFEEAMLVRPLPSCGVPPTLILEWIGQAVALLVAESTSYHGFPVVGSFERCTFGETLLAGDVARIAVTVRSWHPDAARIDGRVTTPNGHDAVSLASATCAFLPLALLHDPDDLRAAIAAARGDFPGPVPARRAREG